MASSKEYLKTTKSAIAMMPDAEMELPYEGAKEEILILQFYSRGEPL